MKMYQVRLTADAVVSASVFVKAENEEEAKKRALELGKDESLYGVDCLHEAPAVYSTSAVASSKVQS